jgi:uncharacterized membrane protein YuzA (DUF378 family)
MKVLHIIAFILLLVGGLNWGLVGLGGFVGGDWNVVHMILGSWPAVEWIVYILVGLSAIYEAVTHKNTCKMCGGMGMGGGMGM